MFLCSDEGKLTVIQHSHCEYWMNAFAHILIVELVLAEMACVSRNVRTTRPESLPAFRSNGPFLSVRSRILILPHSNKFLTTCWMDCDRCIEVGFGCAHFNGYGKALNHFVNAISNSVESDYFFVCSCCD